MMVNKIIYYCDKCGKEIGEEKPDYRYIDLYRYQLCENCEILFNELIDQYFAIEKELDKLLKRYGFGKYMMSKKEMK